MNPANADNRVLPIGYRVFSWVPPPSPTPPPTPPTPPTPPPPTPDHCSVRMNSELSADFAAVVAHATHSLSRQDIDFYFPSEREDINLPVVNPDLLSETEVLSKPFEFEHAFKTPALRVVDQVLSHMNFPDYDIRGNSAIERIVHEAHMQDWWSAGSQAYLELQVSS